MAKPPKDGRKKRVRRTPEQARALILEAAREVLAEVGPDKAGLKEVAKRAGVSHALITHYFGTMAGLLDASIEEHARVLREELISRAAGLGRSPAELTRFAMEMLSDPNYSRVIVWAAMTKRMANEDFFPRRQQDARVVADAIEATSKADGKKPLSRDEIEALMVTVWCAGFGYSIVRDTLWEAFGKESSDERDQEFYGFVGDLVARYVGTDEPDD